MLAFAIRRLLSLIPVLLAVSAVTFFLMHLVPGGPWDGEKTLPPAVVENLNRRYGLDQPLWRQYLQYLIAALQGDLGVSFIRQGESVTSVLGRALPNTILLGGCALALALAWGVGIGIIAALHRNSWVDYLAAVFATAGAGIPNFVVGIMLVVVLAGGLRLTPTGGWGEPQHLILPVCTLAAFPAAYVARITRTVIIEVVRQDYIRTARAKGLPPSLILFRHILRNALIPLITVIGPVAAHLVTGSFVVESLFSVPGVGRLFVQSVLARDYGLIMGT
ncbi:MAG: ABC transporter permease, partial [Chloroflexota bacterium]